MNGRSPSHHHWKHPRSFYSASALPAALPAASARASASEAMTRVSSLLRRGSMTRASSSSPAAMSALSKICSATERLSSTSLLRAANRLTMMGCFGFTSSCCFGTAVGDAAAPSACDCACSTKRIMRRTAADSWSVMTAGVDVSRDVAETLVSLSGSATFISHSPSSFTSSSDSFLPPAAALPSSPLASSASSAFLLLAPSFARSMLPASAVTSFRPLYSCRLLMTKSSTPSYRSSTSVLPPSARNASM
mmetsp:Transcript_25267/g.88154  ORF Transcript_25267/g.88154 Transcript_25267/m.88154 type:complete len:249 (+) Transcript_25267:508-1254(+)